MSTRFENGRKVTTKRTFNNGVETVKVTIGRIWCPTSFQPTVKYMYNNPEFLLYFYVQSYIPRIYHHEFSLIINLRFGFGCTRF